MKMKKLLICVTAAALCVCILAFAACNSQNGGSGTPEGALDELVTRLYADSTLDEETKSYLADYMTVEITPDLAPGFLPADLEYEKAVVSAPAMSSVAYELILVRFADGTDIEAAKKAIKDNANPIKWICVEADQVIVENNGNLVLFAMVSSELLDAEALRTSFMSLK